jgi:CIC family chloride channel protein
VVAGNVDLGFLLILLGLRFFLTTLSLGAGLHGGGVSPGITMGATLGAIVALLFGFTGHTSAAVLGMVAMFAGFAHAPLTATVLAYTLTGAPILILPALFVSLLSYLVVEGLLKRDFFHEKNRG